jgi:hypothetical protein
MSEVVAFKACREKGPMVCWGRAPNMGFRWSGKLSHFRLWHLWVEGYEGYA